MFVCRLKGRVEPANQATLSNIKYLKDGLQVQCVLGFLSSHDKVTTPFNHSFLVFFCFFIDLWMV